MKRYTRPIATVGLLIASAAASCTVGREIDGQHRAGVMLPFGEDVAEAATSLGSVVGGALFGPTGAAIGGTAATALAALVYGRRKGERVGWDERDAHQQTIDLNYDAGRGDAVAVVRSGVVSGGVVPTGQAT